MEAFYSISQDEINPSNIVNKAMEFFIPWMGQQAIWKYRICDQFRFDYALSYRNTHC